MNDLVLPSLLSTLSTNFSYLVAIDKLEQLFVALCNWSSYLYILVTHVQLC